jgi:hypothetical protein
MSLKSKSVLRWLREFTPIRRVELWLILATVWIEAAIIILQ